MVENRESSSMTPVKGDKEAFGAIVDRYQRTIFNVAYRMVNDYEDAMDITQSAFIKAYENLDSYDPSRKFFSWLYRIAVNESLNYVSKRKRQTRLAYEPGDSREYGGEVRSPADPAEQSETDAMLQSGLARLKFDYRLVVILRHFLSLSYREIGDIIDVPEKTVKSRLFTGRQLLKEILVGQGYVE
jgi:RNA polymerase sigma-70 factor (ECF subfamily)